MDNERFIELLTAKMVNELTAEEQEELTQIIGKNPDLRYRKEILIKFWSRKRVSSRDNTAMFDKLLAQIEAHEAIIPQSRSRFLWLRAAAIFLVGISVFAWLYGRPIFLKKQQMSAKWFQKTTRPAVKATLTLADGTIVHLNSSTTLTFPASFNGKTREVYLNGEAYFDVHKDHQHPFIIHANKMNVRVLGTSFNVKSYHNEPVSETTLIRGSVEVTLNDRPSDRIILKPSEKLVVQNSGESHKQPSARGTAAMLDDHRKAPNYSLTGLTYFHNNNKTIIETSWVDNKLVFSDKEFTELAVQLERWYGVRFEFKNDDIRKQRFSGIFEKETLPEALDALKMVTPFKYRITSAKVYIY